MHCHFPPNLSLNFNKLQICFLLSHPKTPFSIKARGTEWRPLKTSGAASSDSMEHVSSLPATDQVILYVLCLPLCSWTLIFLGAHDYSTMSVYSSVFKQFWHSTMPRTRYPGTFIVALDTFSLREGLHSEPASFSPANSLDLPAAPRFAPYFLVSSSITFLRCLLTQWSSHAGLLFSHVGCNFPPWVFEGHSN